MRILLVAPHYAPEFQGGTEAVVRAQARELVRRGHEVRVVAGSDRPWDGAELLRGEVDGIPVATLPRRADEPYDLALARPRLSALVRRELAGAEVVHLHHWSTLSSDLARTLAGDALVALTLHDFFATCPRFFRASPDLRIACPEPGELEPCVRCVAPEAPELDRTALDGGLARRAAAFAAEVAACGLALAPSAFLARRIAPFLRRPGAEPPPIRVLPHGLLWPIERAEAPPAWTGAGGRPLCVLHLGNRAAVKGTLDLVAALAALPPGSAELALAGSEAEPGFDRALASAAGPLPLRFLGPYEPASLSALGRGFDLAAFPSRAQESYGLVVDEALALGLPAWVSDRGALPERLAAGGGAGRVLPAADAARWTAAFAALRADPGELARERARVPASFRGAAETARELEQLYLEALERRA